MNSAYSAPRVSQTSGCPCQRIAATDTASSPSRRSALPFGTAVPSVRSVSSVFASAIAAVVLAAHIRRAEALTPPELDTVIPRCTADQQRSMFDSDNSPYFVFGDMSFANIVLSLSSTSTCSVAHSTSKQTSSMMSMALSHAKFGLMGNDVVGLCSSIGMECYLPLQTGPALFRKGRSKSQLLRDLGDAVAKSSVQRLNTADTLGVAATSSLPGASGLGSTLYSPMVTETPFAPLLTAGPAPVIAIDVELQPSIFPKVFQSDPSANAFVIEFALSAYGTCEDASTLPKMVYRAGGPPRPTAADPFNQQQRWASAAVGAPTTRTATVVRLSAQLPTVRSAWKTSTLSPVVPFVVCSRFASHAYLGSTPANPVFGGWFSLPQLSGVPFHAVFGTNDGGLFFNNTYLPTVTNPAVNRWELYDTTQHTALVAMIASNPSLFTMSYLATPRSGVPDPSRPLFGSVVSLRVSRASIEKSPFLYFAIDTTLDVCNVHLTATFSRTELSKFNDTHYSITFTLRGNATAGLPFLYGGANATLCGAAAAAGAVWLPVSSHAVTVRRCPFGGAFSSSLPVAGGGTSQAQLDARGCFSCAAKPIGDPQLCSGRGVCGVKSAGFFEVRATECQCDLPSRWNKTTNCATSLLPHTKTHGITRTRTPAATRTLIPRKPKLTMTHELTLTHRVKHTRTISVQPPPPLTCYLPPPPTFTPPHSSSGSSSPSALTPREVAARMLIASANAEAQRTDFSRARVRLSERCAKAAAGAEAPYTAEYFDGSLVAPNRKSAANLTRECAAGGGSGGFLYARYFFPAEIEVSAVAGSTSAYVGTSAMGGALIGLAFLFCVCATGGLTFGFLDEAGAGRVGRIAARVLRCGGDSDQLAFRRRNQKENGEIDVEAAVAGGGGGPAIPLSGVAAEYQRRTIAVGRRAQRHERLQAELASGYLSQIRRRDFENDNDTTIDGGVGIGGGRRGVGSLSPVSNASASASSSSSSYESDEETTDDDSSFDSSADTVSSKGDRRGGGGGAGGGMGAGGSHQGGYGGGGGNPNQQRFGGGGNYGANYGPPSGFGGGGDGGSGLGQRQFRTAPPSSSAFPIPPISFAPTTPVRPAANADGGRRASNGGGSCGSPDTFLQSPPTARTHHSYAVNAPYGGSSASPPRCEAAPLPPAFAAFSSLAAQTSAARDFMIPAEMPATFNSMVDSSGSLAVNAWGSAPPIAV